MTKLQLSLTEQEESILSLKAARLGYSVTRYVKFLISQEAASTIDTPIKLTKKATAVFDRGVAEYKAGKATKLESVDDLDQL